MRQAQATPTPTQHPSLQHPHDPVQSWIVIKQMFLEVRSSVAPVHTKLVDKIAGNYVAGTHTHISREQELLHARIDKLFARTTIFPSLQVLLRPVPRPRGLVT